MILLDREIGLASFSSVLDGVSFSVYIVYWTRFFLLCFYKAGENLDLSGAFVVCSHFTCSLVFSVMLISKTRF
jgi:hypothetical protein